MSGHVRSAKHEMDMCNGPILRKMLVFSLPLMFSSILQLLFNAADVIVVGRFAGDHSLAAVGSTGTLVTMLTNLFMGLSIGGNVLTSRYFGAKQEKDLRETVHTAVALSLISGVLLTIVGQLVARPVLELLKTPAEVIDLAELYLRIYFIGMTAMMVYNFGAAILRAVGDTKRPMYYLALAGVINVVLNLFFVIVLKMDVAGVSTATVISQCVSAVLVLRCLLKGEGAMKLNLRELRVDPVKFRMILQIGIPASLQSLMFSISNMSIQSSLNTFGATAVAGNSAAASVDGFLYVSMNAFYQATISFTGQNVGAGRHERINRIMYTALGCVIAVGILMGNVMLLFGEDLLGLYTTSADVIEAGMERSRVMMTTYFLCGMQEVVVGSLRGMGYSMMPMIVSVVGICGLRIVYLATLFQWEPLHNLTSLYMTYPVSWIITFIALIVGFIYVRRRMGQKLQAAMG